jgi:tetratricopeptide (TPR) repeat protein
MIAPFAPTGDGRGHGFCERTQPTFARAYRVSGNEWLAKMEYDKAIADFNEAIRLDPGDRTVYNNRGAAWMCKDEYDKAIDDFSEGIRRDPQSRADYTCRAFAWEHKNEYGKAIADLTECIRLEPQDGSSFRNRGHVWQAMKEYDKAISDFTKAIRLDPQDPIAYQFRGGAWLSKQEWDKAIADFSEIIRLEPDYKSALCSPAGMFAAFLDQRHRDGTKALESSPKASEPTASKVACFYASLAAGYAELRDFASAVKWQTTAIELAADPKQKETYRSHLERYQNKKPFRASNP